MIERARELAKVAVASAGLVFASGCSTSNVIHVQQTRPSSETGASTPRVESIREQCVREYENASFVTKMRPDFEINRCIRTRCAEQCGGLKKCADECEQEEMLLW